MLGNGTVDYHQELPGSRQIRPLHWRIQGQFRRSPGLLGYSLLAHILQKQFGTLSAWEGEAALQRFVGARMAKSRSALRGKMDQTYFVRWNVAGSKFLPRWSEALRKQKTD